MDPALWLRVEGWLNGMGSILRNGILGLLFRMSFHLRFDRFRVGLIRVYDDVWS